MTTQPDADGDIVAVSGDAIKEDLEHHQLRIAHTAQSCGVPPVVLSGKGHVVEGVLFMSDEPHWMADAATEVGYTISANGAVHIHEISLVHYPRFKLGPRLEFWPMGKPSDRVLKMEGRRMRHYRMAHGKHAGRARRAG